MKTVSRIRISLSVIVICVLSGLGLSLLWTSNVQAVLPPRPTVTAPSSDDDTTSAATPMPQVVQIFLRVTPSNQSYWTVVQWQDAQGMWRDVEGWRGEASHGEISWWVAEKDFGKGPFRWAVYPKGGRFIERIEGAVVYRKPQPLLAVSQPFYLPPGSSSPLGIFVTVPADMARTLHKER